MSLVNQEKARKNRGFYALMAITLAVLAFDRLATVIRGDANWFDWSGSVFLPVASIFSAYSWWVGRKDHATTQE